MQFRELLDADPLDWELRLIYSDYLMERDSKQAQLQRYLAEISQLPDVSETLVRLMEELKKIRVKDPVKSRNFGQHVEVCGSSLFIIRTGEIDSINFPDSDYAATTKRMLGFCCLAYDFEETEFIAWADKTSYQPVLPEDAYRRYCNTGYTGANIYEWYTGDNEYKIPSLARIESYVRQAKRQVILLIEHFNQQ